MASAVFLRLLKRKCLIIKLKIKTNDIVVTVHIITILYKYMYRHMYSHIWQAWGSDPGEGRIGVSRNRLEVDEKI